MFLVLLLVCLNYNYLGMYKKTNNIIMMITCQV